MDDVQHTGGPVDGAGERTRPRVVVGVDGSPPSRDALEHAFRTAARRRADLEVLSSFAVEFSLLGREMIDAPDALAIQQRARARASELAGEVQARLAAEGVAGLDDVGVDVLVSEGPAAPALVARSDGAELLVVGSRGRGAVRSALLGSVALHCITHAGCPVVVVHPTSSAGREVPQVVVGVDGSAGSRVALVAALEEAGRTGAEVEVVTTFLVDHGADLVAVVAPDVDRVRAGLQQRAEELLSDALSGWTHGTPPVVRVSVVEGPAADVLTSRSKKADLLVVGSRGRGAFRGLLLGSVALSCAMHAHCPVLVAHPVGSSGAAPADRADPAMSQN